MKITASKIIASAFGLAAIAGVAAMAPSAAPSAGGAPHTAAMQPAYYTPIP